MASSAATENGPPDEHAGSKSRWVCFVLAWLAYAGITALRKPLGVGKKPLAASLHLGKTQLGFLDLAFLMPYALVQVTVGSQADKVHPRTVLFLTLLVSSLSSITFGWWNSLYPLLFLLFIGGSAQAFGWPACVKLISGWFPGKSSSNIFGLYGTCTSVGGIGGTMFAVYLLARWSWRVAFLPQSVFVLALAFIVLAFLPVPASEEPSSSKGSDSPTASPSSSATNTLNLMAIVSVKELCCANFLVKMVRYAFFMWLPMYLSEELKFSDSKAGIMSTTFEIGGFVGTLFSGAIINRLFDGRLLYCTSSLLLLGCLSIGLFIATSSMGIVLNCLTLFMAGAANVATDPILAAMVPMALADLEQTNIKAGLASILNGMGSVGVILEGPLIGAVADHFGWSACLYLLVTLQFVSTFLVYLAARHQRNQALS